MSQFQSLAQLVSTLTKKVAVRIVLLTNGAREEKRPCVQGVPMEVMWRQD